MQKSRYEFRQFDRFSMFQDWLSKQGKEGLELLSIRRTGGATPAFSATVIKSDHPEEVTWEYKYAYSEFNVITVNGVALNRFILWERWLVNQLQRGWILAAEIPSGQHPKFIGILKRRSDYNMLVDNEP